MVISVHKWSTTQWVLKSHKNKMGAIITYCTHTHTHTQTHTHTHKHFKISIQNFTSQWIDESLNFAFWWELGETMTTKVTVISHVFIAI